MIRRLTRNLFETILLAILIAMMVYQPPAIAEEFTRIDGEIAGAPYSLFRPDVWNGNLVLLVHGSIGEQFEALAPGFATQGYAVAYATLAEDLGDGDALKHITRDTHLVEAVFRQKVGTPERTYLVGFSRGAHNMQQLLERTPSRYDGMLSFCGGNGGAQLQWDHFFTARVLFDHYYPGVLPGTADDVPGIDLQTYLDQVAGVVAFTIASNPAPAIEMASVDQFELPYTSVPELINGIVESLAIHTVAVNNLLTAAGGNPYDNSTVIYTGTSNDAALNSGVQRFIADRGARVYLQRWYEPRGRTGATPVLIVHTARDGIVPERSNNDKYESLVVANGEGEYLVRRTIDRAGHCNFTGSEIFGSFTDLVGWAEWGARPQP